MAVMTITITSEGRKINPEYGIDSVEVRKQANKIPSAEIVLIDGSSAGRDFEISKTDFFKPGKEIEIKLRYEGEKGPDGKDAAIFKGIVTRHGVKANRQRSLLTVGLKDVCVQLTKIRKRALFKEKSDKDIWEQLLKGTAKVKTKKLKNTKPKHAEMVQFSCTDWDFLLTRAEANGCWVFVDDGEVTVDSPDLAQGEEKTLEYGLDQIYDFDLEADVSNQQEEVSSASWDIRKQKLTQPKKAKEIRLNLGNITPQEGAKAMGAKENTLVHAVDLPSEELEAWSQAGMVKARFSMMRGRVSIKGTAQFKLGQMLELKGMGERFNGKSLISGVRHQINVSGWKTDLQFGLGADWFMEQNDTQELPAAGLLPAVHGLQIGIVDTFEEDPLKQLRVRVRVPAISEKEGIVWARLASPEAGKERGYFFRPEHNDEVVLGFLSDDPRQAVILGGLYSEKNTPPFPLEEIKKENFKKGIKTKGKLEWGFDDENKTIHFKTPADNSFTLTEDTKNDAAGMIWTDQHKNVIKSDKNGLTIKEAGDDRIVIEKNKTIRIEDKAGNQILLDRSKGITIKDKNGNKFETNSNGITLETKNKILLKGKEIELKGTSKVVAKAKKIDLN